MMQPFHKPRAKLTIGSLDQSDLHVVAQYNPKELKIAQTIAWHGAKPVGQQEPDALAIEFAGMQPQTLQLELFFDGYENNGAFEREWDFDIFDKTVTLRETDTVRNAIARLKQLASVRSPDSPIPAETRPHFCVVTWGDGGVPPLQCVIESLTTTYQAFSSTGTVLRATCAIALKQANRIDAHKRSGRHADVAP